MHTSTTASAMRLEWRAEQLLAATAGQWLNNKAPTDVIQRIITDSRQAQAGDVFLALRGEKFDAHDFVSQVASQGATAVIVERAQDDIDIAQYVVKDSRLALGQLGAFRRNQIDDLKVIALTGSSGKTTTKEMLRHILSPIASTLVTRGNLNNDLGVPMMMLELLSAHRFAVFELGANHVGEIDYSSALVKPDVAGILNIGNAHLGEFGGRDKIAVAKAEIYRHINSEGKAILPKQDQFYSQLKQAAGAYAQISFGDDGDVYASDIQLWPTKSQFILHFKDQQASIDLGFVGRHNVDNALAAASLALGLGIPFQAIVDGLNQATTVAGRLQFQQKDHVTLIDDTYNANPQSMRAAAEVLLQQVGYKIMVLGDIGELGDQALDEHFKLGKDLGLLAIDCFVSVGELAAHVNKGLAESEHSNHIHFSSQAEALPFLVQLSKQINQPLALLFKGSRYTQMEKLLVRLLEQL